MTTDPTIHLMYDLFWSMVYMALIIYGTTQPRSRLKTAVLMFATVSLIMAGVDSFVKMFGGPTMVEFVYHLGWILLGYKIVDRLIAAYRTVRQGKTDA